MSRFLKPFKNLLTKTPTEPVMPKINLSKPKHLRKFDLKGKKKEDFVASDANLYDSQDIKKESLEEHEPKLQKRSVRAKSLGYLGLFMVWYCGVVTFIMYRVKGDDLENLEKEAQERIEFAQKMKEFTNIK